MKTLKRGDIIRIRRASQDDSWSTGTVDLASDKTDPFQSVMLVLDGGAIRAGGGVLIGALPLIVDYVGEKVKGLMTGEEYEIEVQG